MPEYLRIATAVVALAVAAWAGVAAARDRSPNRAMFGGLGVLVLFAFALVGSAIEAMVSGHRAPSMATFIGYLIAFLVIPVAGWALAWMEPSKWGSVIIAASAVVEAVLVVRLEQVWTGI